MQVISSKVFKSTAARVLISQLRSIKQLLALYLSNMNIDSIWLHASSFKWHKSVIGVQNILKLTFFTDMLWKYQIYIFLHSCLNFLKGVRCILRLFNYLILHDTQNGWHRCCPWVRDIGRLCESKNFDKLIGTFANTLWWTGWYAWSHQLVGSRIVQDETE